ncbi:unnamed protein product [Taenia asiatica]|uniref:Coatomer subunit zeta n=1 Tax=Taenia asiatica TaxID=60517 RepID=A0A0R3WEX4_TAEAS|nr:unnamed protein product [Taenia asiatica]
MVLCFFAPGYWCDFGLASRASEACLKLRSGILESNFLWNEWNGPTAVLFLASRDEIVAMLLIGSMERNMNLALRRNARSLNSMVKHYSVEEIMSTMAEHVLRLLRSVEIARQMRLADQLNRELVLAEKKQAGHGCVSRGLDILPGSGEVKYG